MANSTLRSIFKSFSLSQIILSFALLFFGLITTHVSLSQVTVASDNAGNYSGSWTNSSNQGTGFGAWTISPGASSGVFIGNPANNGMGTTNIGTTAFGMFANGSAFVNATRDFNTAMRVGDVFTFNWATNWDPNGGGKGFDLRDASNNNIITVNHGGSSSAITVSGSLSATISNNYGTTPMTVTVTRTSASQYTLSITRRDTNEGTYTGTISSSNAIARINLFIGNTNSGDGNRNTYFNNFQITSSAPTINTTGGVVASSPGSGTSGFVGNTITINGQNLNTVTTVRVGGSSGTGVSISSQNATSLTFVAPDAGGQIYVENPSGNTTSSESYTNQGFRTTTSGAWNSGATWLGGSVPTSGTSTNVTIAHNVTSTSGDVNVGRLTVNSSTTLTITASTSITVNTASTNSGTITSNGTLAVSGVTYTNGGTININGSFQINQGSFASGGTWNYGTTGTLVYNNSTGPYGAIDANHSYWPSTNGPINVTVQNGGGINMGVSRTVTGTFLLVTGANAVQGTALTLNGTVQINGGNFQTTPTYGSSSTLIYNTGGSYGISNEWSGNSTTAGSGVPNNVTIQNSTTLTFPTTNRGCAGNFNISSGGATLNASGGGLFVAGNFNNSGTFTHNNRTVTLNRATSTSTQSITGSLSNTSNTTTNHFFNLTINTTNSGTVTLSTPVNVINTLTLTSGIVTTDATNILYVTATGTGAITGTPGSSCFINGPLSQTLPTSLASGSTYVYPVGKSGSGYYPISLVNPTTSTGTITVTAEAFAASSGGSAGTNLGSISTAEYWSVASSGNFTGSSISVTRPTAVSPNNAIGRSTTLTGAYASIGGTASGSSITVSGNATGAAQQFFVLGVLAIPTLSTNSITSITNTTATGGGNTLSDGGSSITAKGVVWSTTSSPALPSVNSTSDGSGTANFSSSITGLSPQTQYFVRAYATNANETSYGSEVSFRTLSTEPTSATTNFAAASQSTSQINLSWSAASLPASGYTNSGYIIIRRIDGTNPTTTGVTDGVAPASLSLASGTTLVTTITSGATISFNHTSLTASLAYNYMIIPFTWDGTNATTYNYRTSDPQTANANTYVFVTQVTTGRPLTGTWYVGDYAGGGNGSGTTNFQFQVDQGSWNKSEVGIGQNTDGTTGWNWNDAFYYADNGASKRVQRNIGGVQFTSAGTWYVAGRARTNPTDPWSYADASGSTNDVNLSLSTSSGNTPYYTVSALGDPTVTSASAVSANQIDLAWSQFASRDVLVVRYAAAASVTAPTTGQTYIAGNTIGSGTVIYDGNATSVSSTGLTAGTAYKYIFYSENYGYYSAGVSSGTITTTAATAPVIASPSKSSITHNSAQLGASISSDGGSSVTARGTAWKTTSPVIATDNQLAEGGTTTGSFSHSRSSLSPQTLYYYVGYSTNNAGTSITTEDNFRTLSSPVTAQPTSFVATAANTQLDVSWNTATFPASGATQAGYLVIYATGTPSLSSSNGAAPAAGVGTLINITPTNLPSEPALTTTITGLTNGTTYNLLLIPYTWDGTNATTYNYLTSGALVTVGVPSLAATITSNGTGGGAWTDGASWQGGVAPVSGDNVVIATSDVISVSSPITRNPGTTTTVNGTFRINNSGFASGGTWVYGASSTLQFATTGNYNVQSDHIYWPSSNSPANVIVGSGGITLGSNAQANRTVTGNFTTSGPVTLSNSSVLTINGICQRNSGGSFANAPLYGANGTLRYNTNTTTARGPEWSSNTGAGRPHNVIIAGNTTLDYPNGNNDNDLAIGGDLTIESGNLYMDFGDGAAAGQISVGGDVSIAGNVSLGDGSGGDLYVGGDWTRTSGTLNNNGRSVYFNGSGTQTINNAETFANLRVDKSSGGNLVLTGNTTVTSTLTLTAANTATLVVNPGVVLTFATGQFNGDPVVLKSSAVGTAAIGNITGSLTGATNVTVERYIPAQRKWRMLTAPLTGSSSNSIYANWQNGGTEDGSTGAIFWSNTGGSGLYTGGIGASILSFNPNLSTQGGWEGVTSTQASGSLFSSSANNSYIAFITGPYNTSGSYISGTPAATTLKATGSLRSGAVSFTGLTNGKYHIVGNPYASAVNFNTIGRTSAGSFVYVWDPQIGTLGGYTPIDNLAGEILESGQSFLVLAQGGNATISFAESDKSTNTSNTMFRRQNTDPRFTVKLNKFLNGTPKLFDRAWVDYQVDGSVEVNDKDAIKPSNFTENLSIVRNSTDLMVERRPNITANDTINLRLWRTTASQYQFELVPERMSLPVGTTAVLQDLYLGTETVLNMTDAQVFNFTVNQDAASTGNRFRIVFRANTVTPVTNLNGEKAFAVYPNPVSKGGVMQLEFRNRAAGTYNIRIFDMAGAQVQQKNVRHAGGTAVQQIRLNTNLTPGTYIAEVVSQNGIAEKVKLIIQ